MFLGYSENNDDVVIVFMLIGLVIGIFVYLLPTYIASRKGHKDTGVIFVVNLLFGWTFLGYIVSFIWAVSSGTGENTKVIIQNAPGAPHTPPQVPEPPTLEQQLVELKSLRDKDLLTEDEYQAKRSKLIS
jgi:hypothetical protein